MGDIYSRGIANLICLRYDRRDMLTEEGTADIFLEWTAKEAKQCISALVDDMQAGTDNYERARAVLIEDEVDFKIAIDGSGPFFTSYHGGTERLLFAVRRVYQHRWFNRVWTVKEVLLAAKNTVYINELELDFDDILKAGVWLIHKQLFLPFGIGSGPQDSGLRGAIYMWVTRERSERASMSGLLDLLRYFGERQATDPKDIVFGLLGLYAVRSTSVELPTLLVPDYQKTLGEVYLDAARYILSSESTSLDLWANVSVREEDLASDMASWVPRWERPANYREGDAIRFGNAWRQFCADLRASRLLRFGDDSKVLVLGGIILGTIARVSKRLQWFDRDDADGSARSQDILDPIRKVWQDVWPGTAIDDLGHELELALARTLVAGIAHNYLPVNDDIVFAYRAYLRHLPKHRTPPRRLTEVNTRLLDKGNRLHRDKDQILASQYAQAFRTASLHRRLLITDRGSLGLGPPIMRSGDIAVILYGASVPFVLRPCSDVNHETSYKLVGECYVYGVMFGQAVEAHRAKKDRDQTFHIL
ncbi:hypothetical protein LTR62_000305 [Meristemomyces frigidus]|uniref:Heterokaryon incompatibility domain-containing protein n=1 Tax=Meristemomyces frigidus TaxID=1508187 RepID=A0AAN7TZE8_9PEZI|nr:hypothetical protein LTR62_000305 [Meristemomyces frigidus]